MIKCKFCGAETEGFSETGKLCLECHEGAQAEMGLLSGESAAHEVIEPRTFHDTDDHLFDTALHGPYSA